MGLLAYAGALGLYEAQARALSILPQVTALRMAHRLPNERTSLPTVTEELSTGQFASGQSLFIGALSDTL